MSGKTIPPQRRFMRSVWVDALVRHMAGVTGVGTVMTYADATGISGVDMSDERNRRHIQSAVRICRNRHGQNWECLRTVGYHLAGASATAAVLDGERRALVRRAARQLRKVANVQEEEKPADLQMRLAVEATRWSLVRRSAGNAATRRLEAAVVDHQNRSLPPAAAVLAVNK